MRNMKFLPAIIGATLIVAIILFVAFHFVFIDLFVDLWWYESLKLETYFWLRPYCSSPFSFSISGLPHVI